MMRSPFHYNEASFTSCFLCCIVETEESVKTGSNKLLISTETI